MKKTFLVFIFLLIPAICFPGTASTVRNDAESSDQIPDDGTWDEQEESFTCLANLSIGENVLTFIGSDGTRTGSDSVTITRTIPGEYTTRGAGFSIKGCTLK